MWATARKELSAPDGTAVRKQNRKEGADDRDLAVVKDFFRIYVATSQVEMVEKLTADSLT